MSKLGARSDIVAESYRAWNANDRAQRRESRFRSTTREEIGNRQLATYRGELRLKRGLARCTEPHFLRHPKCLLPYSSTVVM